MVCGIPVLTFWRNLHILFHSDCTANWYPATVYLGATASPTLLVSCLPDDCPNRCEGVLSSCVLVCIFLINKWWDIFLYLLAICISSHSFWKSKHELRYGASFSKGFSSSSSAVSLTSYWQRDHLGNFLKINIIGPHPVAFPCRSKVRLKHVFFVCTVQKMQKVVRRVVPPLLHSASIHFSSQRQAHSQIFFTYFSFFFFCLALPQIFASCSRCICCDYKHVFVIGGLLSRLVHVDFCCFTT